MNTWEYRTKEEWETLIKEWLGEQKLTDGQKQLVESYKMYLTRLDSETISSRFKYETNGMLNTIFHRLVHHG
jgi:hypothetical protein